MLPCDVEELGCILFFVWCCGFLPSALLVVRPVVVLVEKV